MADEGRIKLPERSTRGKRMRAQLQEEDNEAGKGIMHYKPYTPPNPGCTCSVSSTVPYVPSVHFMPLM